MPDSITGSLPDFKLSRQVITGWDGLAKQKTGSCQCILYALKNMEDKEYSHAMDDERKKMAMQLDGMLYNSVTECK